MEKETIYVVGHKNPDTDSICSAMAYARLRQQQGASNVYPARAGNINRQTEFVLEELGLSVPKLLVDVFPRVKDVVSDQVVTIHRDAPVSRALELLHLHSIRMLPVVDDRKMACGLVVLKRLSERFLVPSQEKEIRRVVASPASVKQCLKGNFLTCFEEDEVEEFQLYVGAMASATFEEKLQAMVLRKVILITGNRENVQRMAVEQGVRMLIVTGNLPVSPDIVALAQENKVSILSTGFDTATSTWLTRLATPVHCLISEECPTLQMNDRLEDLRLKLLHNSAPGVVVVDSENTVLAIATKSNLLAPSPVKLVLVDHNELSQAVSGADKVEILEVIDHHRLGNFHTTNPIRFINQPLGSTCSVVATLFRQAGIVPDKVSAGLMLAGLLSDTVILKSPTTTQEDKALACWLGDLSGFDPQDLGSRIFAAGSTLAAYPSVRHLILTDFKEYGTGSCQFGMGQVEVVNFHEFESMREQITAGLFDLKTEKGLDVAGLLVTDIVQETSMLLALGGREFPYVIGYPCVGPNLYELKGVLSRKKQLVPHLLKVLKD